jgi:regulator of sirC expression with transglutaminase-like and TPR domain
VVLYDEEGFAGNQERYDDPRNSFLNDVITRRTGIPISLGVVYLDVARQAGVPMEGVNFPGHFLVRWKPPAGRRARPELIVDPFHAGASLSEADCRELLRKHLGDEASYDRRLLARAAKRDILVRMLVNLKRLYVSMRSFPQARDTVELLLALDPLSLEELRDRGLLSYHLQQFPAALRDLETYLLSVSRSGGASDEESRDEYRQVWDHVKTLRRRVAGMN